MEIEEGVIRRGPSVHNTLRDLHNFSGVTQPHSIIVKHLLQDQLVMEYSQERIDLN